MKITITRVPISEWIGKKHEVFADEETGLTLESIINTHEFMKEKLQEISKATGKALMAQPVLNLVLTKKIEEES